MIDQARAAEYVLDRLWFSCGAEVFTGRGLMLWNPDDGFNIQAFLAACRT